MAHSIRLPTQAPKRWCSFRKAQAARRARKPCVSREAVSQSGWQRPYLWPSAHRRIAASAATTNWLPRLSWEAKITTETTSEVDRRRVLIAGCGLHETLAATLGPASGVGEGYPLAPLTERIGPPTGPKPSSTIAQLVGSGSGPGPS